MKQTPVHENHNVDVLNLFPSDCKKILEFGSSSGALAREYKKNNTKCKYIGVEINSEFGELSKRHCDEVIIGNCEDFDQDFWSMQKDVDLYVFADVLEHLIDPWALLRRINQCMKVGSKVIASIPNIAHWSIFHLLSTGDFRYAENGLLDRTHLRFFTRKTIEELFEQAGFVNISIQGRVFQHAGMEDIISIIKRLATRAGGNAELAAIEARNFQYLITAEKIKS
jgi:SAM-dependent methyltransferase